MRKKKAGSVVEYYISFKFIRFYIHRREKERQSLHGDSLRNLDLLLFSVVEK